MNESELNKYLKSYVPIIRTFHKLERVRYIARVLLCILVCTVSIMFSFCVVVREKFPSVYSLTSLSFNHVACVFGISVCCKRLATIIPRPSHCPIFDCLQCDQKLTVGEGLGMRLARDTVSFM